MYLIDRVIEYTAPLGMFETIGHTYRRMIILFGLQLEIHVTEIHGCPHGFNPLSLGLFGLFVHCVEYTLLLLGRHDPVQFELVHHLLGECPLVLINRVHDLDGPPPELLRQLHQQEPLVESLNLVPDVLRPSL